jgi:hypothetical protein
MGGISTWVAEKLAEDEQRQKVVGHTAEDFLIIETKNGYRFFVAVLSAKNVIQVAHVQPLFVGDNKPQLVINVPSKTLWSGAAIDFIHSEQAAFGTMGDIARAGETNAAGSFCDKNMGFFINSMEQHGNVLSVSYIYESVFEVERRRGESLIVAVIDAYNMSAEDVRNTRARIGRFDIVVKSSSYGSITEQAEAAADSMGAKALTFKGLMKCLAG